MRTLLVSGSSSGVFAVSLQCFEYCVGQNLLNIPCAGHLAPVRRTGQSLEQGFTEPDEYGDGDVFYFVF